MEPFVAEIVQEILEIVQDLCDHILQNVIEAANRARVLDELAVVRNYSNVILDQVRSISYTLSCFCLIDFCQSILQILLYKVATNDEDATIRYHLQHIVDRAILDRCLTVHYSLSEQARQVHDNIVVRSVHDKIVSEISAEVILALLQDQLRLEIDTD